MENVSGYCRENGYNVDERRFIDFYESKGWMVGKNKMKDWRAAVRNLGQTRAKRGDAERTRTNKFSPALVSVRYAMEQDGSCTRLQCLIMGFRKKLNMHGDAQSVKDSFGVRTGQALRRNIMMQI